MRESCLQSVGALDSGTHPRLAELVARMETGARAQGPPRSTEPCRLSWVSTGLALNHDDEQIPRCARTSGSLEREGRGGGLVGKGGLGRKQKLPRGFQTGQGPQAAASALAGHRNQEISCWGWRGAAQAGVGQAHRVLVPVGSAGGLVRGRGNLPEGAGEAAPALCSGGL